MQWMESKTDDPYVYAIHHSDHELIFNHGAVVPVKLGKIRAGGVTLSLPPAKHEAIMARIARG